MTAPSWSPRPVDLRRDTTYPPALRYGPLLVLTVVALLILAVVLAVTS